MPPIWCPDTDQTNGRYFSGVHRSIRADINSKNALAARPNGRCLGQTAR